MITEHYQCDKARPLRRLAAREPVALRAAEQMIELALPEGVPVAPLAYPLHAG